MTKLARLATLALAVSACVSYAQAAGVRTYENSNDAQRDSYDSTPTRIEQRFPHDDNSWVITKPTGTYGCYHNSATNTIHCP